MNFRNILKEIEQADPKTYEQVSGRRDILKSLGSKVALAALPFAIGSLYSTKAAAKTTVDPTVVDALNFALELSYFQYNFFHTAVNTGGLIPSSGTNSIGVNDMPGFVTIETNEKAHITFLNTAIIALGGTPYTPKNYAPLDLNPAYVPTAYDFTMGGTYEVFSQYSVFLIIAQTFQDTCVRALKGQLPTVLSNTTVLTQFLQMQATEARSAAFIRLIRRYNGGAEYPAPWITNDISPLVELKTNYNGEDNLIQSDMDIHTLADNYDYSGVVPKASATAAFDETLDQVTVTKFIKKFMLT